MIVESGAAVQPIPPTLAGSERTHRRRADRAGLLVPSLVAAIVTLWWFPWDRFLAAGDVTPFLRHGDARELFDLWNHRASGAGSTSVAVAHAFEVFIIRATGFFGGSEVVAQHIFYALVMAFAAFGAAYLARAFVTDPIAVAAAGLLGSLNVFVLLHLPNPLTMIWLGLVGTLAGVLVRVARGVPLSPLIFAALTLPASYLSLNPPLLVTAVLAVLAVAAGASLLGGPGGSVRAWRFLGRSLPWTVGLNLWWVVPTVLATVAREGLSVSAVTRVEDWSWSQSRNSIPNVLSFTADWGWVHPEYMPYARTLDSYPWSLARWILPALAIAAPILVIGRRRVAAWTLLGAAMVATILAKGLHWPLGEVNLWAYHHVPGLWLLRDPMSKVGGVLLLAAAVLSAMTIERLLARLGSSASHRVARGGSVALGAVVCLALAFPFPLWLGRIGPGGGDLPSARVAVPAEWRELAAAVNHSPRSGKALVLPLDPYYQVTTTWGFHGADQIASQLVTRPVLQLLPDGYFTPAGTLPEMLRAVEQNLLGGNGPRAAKLLQLLGVSHVILRSDLATGQVVRPVADRRALAVALALIPGVGAPRDFGVGQVYDITEPGELVWAPTSVTGLLRRDEKRTVAALADLSTTGAAVLPGTAPVDQLSWEAPDRRRASVGFELRRGGQYQVGLADSTPARYRVRVAERGNQSTLQVFDPVNVTLDGEVIGSQLETSVPVRSPDLQAVTVGDRTSVAHGGVLDIDLRTPSLMTAYAASGRAVRGDHYSRVGDCGPRPRDSTAPSTRRIRGGRSVRASAGVGCVTYPGPTLSPDGLYRVHIESRARADGMVRACLWMNGPGVCAPMPARAAGRGWTTSDVVVRTAPDTTGVVLYLYADATTRPAVAEYRDVSITPLEWSGGGTIAPITRAAESRQLARGKHRIAFARPTTSERLNADSPLGDCQRNDTRTPRQAGLAVEPIRRGLRLRASAHAACVTATIPPDMVGGDLALSMDVRTIRGRAASACLWLDGPNQCAELPPIPAAAGWRHFAAEVPPTPGTRAARLYLYAYGGAGGTVVEYRNLRVGPVVPEIVNVKPAAPQGAVPSVQWQERGSSHFSARVAGGRYPAVVVLDESYGHGWEVSGTKVRGHTQVNGYANAWVLASAGNLTIRYGPATWARGATLVSAMVAATAIAVVLVRRRRWTRLAVEVSGSRPRRQR